LFALLIASFVSLSSSVTFSVLCLFFFAACLCNGAVCFPYSFHQAVVAAPLSGQVLAFPAAALKPVQTNELHCYRVSRLSSNDFNFQRNLWFTEVFLFYSDFTL